MEENYCPLCRLTHLEILENCCRCDGELVIRPDSSNGEDKSCPICIDQIEMA